VDACMLWTTYIASQVWLNGYYRVLTPRWVATPRSWLSRRGCRSWFACGTVVVPTYVPTAGSAMEHSLPYSLWSRRAVGADQAGRRPGLPPPLGLVPVSARLRHESNRAPFRCLFYVVRDGLRFASVRAAALANRECGTRDHPGAAREARVRVARAHAEGAPAPHLIRVAARL
jgi:hypothetical protein